MGEIVTFRVGKTPPRAESEWWGNKGDMPWVSIADMLPDTVITSSKESMTEKSIHKFFLDNISPKGTLIMSFKLTLGRVSILGMNAVHNEAIVSIFPKNIENNTIRNYLFKVLPLLSQMGDSKDAIKGRTLNSQSLNNLLIPLPPLNEQNHIVNQIDKLIKYVDTLCL